MKYYTCCPPEPEQPYEDNNSNNGDDNDEKVRDGADPNQVHFNRSYNSALAKLAILEIPYSCKGFPSENIHIFKRKVIAHCEINAINDANLVKLLLDLKDI